MTRKEGTYPWLNRKIGSYFASGFGVNYGRSLLTEKPAWLSSDDDYINPLAKKCLIGRRFPSANVVCESDGIASYLSDRIASDGRWRVIYFCGDFKKVPRLAKEMKEFGEYLKSDQSFVRKYSSCLSLGKVKEAIEVLLVHASARTTTEWDDFPIAFRPRDNAGCVDYWRIFAGLS
jgi:phenol 2-monooxygenase